MNRYALLLGCLSAALAIAQNTARSAQPEAVGIFSLVDDAQIATALGLSDSQKRQFTAWGDRRDIGLLAFKSLPDAEKQAKIAEYRIEGEKEGMRMLSEPQRAKLQELAAAKGVKAVAPAVGKVETTPRPSIRVAIPADAKPQAEPTAEAAPAVDAKPQAVAPPKTVTQTTQASKPVESKPLLDVKPSPDGKVQFSFRYQPWPEVLDWFARQASLSLMMNNPPDGTFNYTDPRRYSPEEAIDLLNGVLLTKGITLIRNGQMLIVCRVDEIPPILVPQIALTELDKKGQHELVRVLFQLDRITPEEAELEAKKMIGPQGAVVVLGKAKQLLVTETAGRLRAIRSVIEAMENPPLAKDAQLHKFELKNVSAEQVLVPLRQLLGIPLDAFAAPDGSIRLVVEPTTGKILASGKPERIAQLRELLEELDPKDAPAVEGAKFESPQLEVYAITTADPPSVLAVLQTLLAGMPDVRLALDAKTGNLNAWARPSVHGTIRAVINQMQRDSRQVEVIKLRRVDPQLAVLSINKLFGATSGAGGTPPIVDAEPITKQLLVSGTTSQVEQIRSLLRKMGETDTTADAADSGKGNIRMIPLTGRAAREALEKADMFWPLQRENRIRVVTPAAAIESRSGPQGRDLDRVREVLRDRTARESAPRDVTQPPADTEKRPAIKPTGEREPAAARRRSSPANIVLVQARTEKADDAPAAEEEAQPAPEPKKPATEKADEAKKPAEILVAPGKGGIIIASDDLKALDAFEEMLNTFGGSQTSGGPEFTIFYLKHAKSEIVAELLEQVFEGGSSSSGGGSLLGDLAGAALGSSGGIIGSILGGDGGDSFSGSVQIVPDPRLNALVVQGRQSDLDTIEQLLTVIDQPGSPEQQEVNPRPRFIPVHNNPAEDIAETIKQVYAERLAGGASANQQRQPTPQEFFQMLRGGGRGGRGDRQRGQQRQEIEKMTVSVNTTTNELIVTAPDQLFDEVKLLVEQLDRVSSESMKASKVVTLKQSSPLVIQQALVGLLGDKVQTTGVKSATTSRTASGTTQGGTTTQSSGQQQSSDRESEERNRRRSEFFEMMRQGGGQFGGPFGGQFGGDRGGDRGDRGDRGRGGDRGGDRGDRGRGGDSGGDRFRGGESRRGGDR